MSNCGLDDEQRKHRGRGRFWLQGNLESEGISGCLLLISGSHSLLELDERLTPLPLASPQKLADQSLTVHGTLKTREPVTMPSAFNSWTRITATARSGQLSPSVTAATFGWTGQCLNLVAALR